MADRPVRRTLRRTRNAVNGSGKPIVESTTDVGDTSDDIPVTISEHGDVQPVVDGTGDEPANEPVAVGRIGTVEIDPNNLSEYIAASDRRDDSGDSGTGNGDKPKRKWTRRNAARGATPIDVLSVKMMASAAEFMTRMELFDIDDTEAKNLVESYNEFAKYHTVPMVTAKRMSEVKLASALFGVFGTRLLAKLRNRRKGPQQVVPIDRQQPQPKVN